MEIEAIHLPQSEPTKNIGIKTKKPMSIQRRYCDGKPLIFGGSVAMYIYVNTIALPKAKKIHIKIPPELTTPYKVLKC